VKNIKEKRKIRIDTLQNRKQKKIKKKKKTRMDMILDGQETKALFSWHANPKYFFFHPSHQIFRYMHGALNVGKKDN
jgi:hypothetical protein